MLFDTLSIIGVGLIGGSIGLAARRRNIVRRVKGVGPSAQGMDQAVRMGAIDEIVRDVETAVQDADLVVFCTPVDQIAEGVVRVAEHCGPGTIITDTGSTKAAIVKTIDERLPPGHRFVGGHPLAGSQKSGVEHADGSLFAGRVTVLTQTAGTDAGALEKVSEFWRGLGSRVHIMTPEDHDRAVALTSHVPHVVASALAGSLPDDLFKLAASGFCDTTRVAAGEPAIWTPILMDNAGAVRRELAALCARLDLFQDALKNEDADQLNELLAEGKRRRDALGS